MLRTRILAAATATFLALGMAVGGASPAFANHKGSDAYVPTPMAGVEVINDNGLTCDKAGYEKPEGPSGTDRSAGEYTAAWGGITWDGASIIWNLNQGYDVDLCVKGSVFVSKIDTSGFTGSKTYNFSAHTGHAISHVGFIVRSAPSPAEPGFTKTDQSCVENVVTAGSITGLTREGKISYTLTFNGQPVLGAGPTWSGLAPGTYTLTPSPVGSAVLTSSAAITVEIAATTNLCTLDAASVGFTYTAPDCLVGSTVNLDPDQRANATLISAETAGSVKTFVFRADEGSTFSADDPLLVGNGPKPIIKSVTVSNTTDASDTLTVVFELLPRDAELCEPVTVPEITVVDTCLEQSYTITAAEGVSYSVSVNGDESESVMFEEGEETVTITADPFDEIVVTATADEGYVLPENYEPFEYTFAFDEECLPTAPVTSASVTFTQPDCLGNLGTYTLTNGLGVIWTVDGLTVAGNTKYTAPTGSTPSIEARLAGASSEYPLGFGWDSPEPRTLWNLSFAAPTGCITTTITDLPTLALTGASNALGGLGVIAILIMMAGTGLVVARRREAASIQG